MPPWAQLVFERSTVSFARTMTSPCRAASIAQRRPATPVPTTSVSVKICGSSALRNGISSRRSR
jgi:hypothetical protein